ncbi:thiamine pyrophosphate-binding protein [Gelidibacter pelagius]|uniref:Thiamine pyrophosphate-binding protein n=1 Tax=Gelidibacter pelagius TaxID=2819985 RepID=A0ABS3SRN7_9FLAO|nr:thiamine pyrophosphate-binding protein [Gelidibacter pelagius]MBO3098372.1 thiamine pyrophosphate-binding protein [Gelidibacter pelagius]
MKKTGAWLLVKALEQLPISHTFGIPGVHNTEIYDELNKSSKIKPILVTHEGGGAFMADAVSRTSETIGTMVIVPAAGITHALSGIGEAFLDGIPMLIISGGIRTDLNKSYQLHEWDMHSVLSGITKKTYHIKKHEDIMSSVFEAYTIAVSGNPGPVFIEIPTNIQMFKGDVSEILSFKKPEIKPTVTTAQLDEAIKIISKSKKVGMFLGWGAKEATATSIQIAERLNAPVSTTLQGFSVFPGDHELFTGMGFGPASVPASENAFKDVDCLIAVGTRFAEIPTGSFGAKVPENLIHIDIDENVFDKNYKSKLAIQGDAKLVLDSLLAELINKNIQKSNPDLISSISKDRQAYYKEWSDFKFDRVNPYNFFKSLRAHLDDDAITVLDDGNHTFLTVELFQNLKSKHLISPTDFNCMGYCVPAAIGAKFANPNKQVVGIVGDGAFLMTGLELLTAKRNELGIAIFVFHDGELSQISQGQEIPYNRKTATVLGDFNIDGIAHAVGADYLVIENDDQIDAVISKALKAAQSNKTVLVDVHIDYKKRTRFTQGVVKSVLGNFPLSDKVRFIGRAVKRKILG